MEVEEGRKESERGEIEKEIVVERERRRQGMHDSIRATENFHCVRKRKKEARDRNGFRRERERIGGNKSPLSLTRKCIHGREKERREERNLLLHSPMCASLHTQERREDKEVGERGDRGGASRAMHIGSIARERLARGGQRKERKKRRRRE